MSAQFVPIITSLKCILRITTVSQQAKVISGVTFQRGLDVTRYFLFALIVLKAIWCAKKADLVRALTLKKTLQAFLVYMLKPDSVLEHVSDDPPQLMTSMQAVACNGLEVQPCLLCL